MQLIKSDINKVYDSNDSRFLQDIMLKMGFNADSIQLKYTTSVSYFLLYKVNGVLTEKFTGRYTIPLSVPSTC
jgi:hypothetical protein